MRGLRTPFTVLIGIVWTAGFLDGLLRGTYTALGLVTPLMLIVVGVMFARNGNNRP